MVDNTDWTNCTNNFELVDLGAWPQKTHFYKETKQNITRLIPKSEINGLLDSFL